MWSHRVQLCALALRLHPTAAHLVPFDLCHPEQLRAGTAVQFIDHRRKVGSFTSEDLLGLGHRWNDHLYGITNLAHRLAEATQRTDRHEATMKRASDPLRAAPGNRRSSGLVLS
jgi:hypothetical protein